MPSRNVVITGLGPISAVGTDLESFWSSLIAGRHGFSRLTSCDVSRSPSKIGAEIRDFRLEDFIPRGKAMARRMPRSTQFAIASAQLALEDSKLESQCDPDRIGISVGTSVASMRESLQVRDRWKETQQPMRPYEGFHLFNHSAACLLSALFDVRGPVSTTSSGCNSCVDALGQSARLIETGHADAVIVVGTDCEIVPEALAILNASNSLATGFNDDPGRASRPFEIDRTGNVIGEGAAAIVLESGDHARARGARIYASLAGFSICSAGRRRTYDASDPDCDLRPSVRSLTGAMEEAGWLPRDVDLINANGSSSVLYDRLEAQAIREALGASFPETRVHSIKSMLGQHGAGSSAFQVVTACLSIQHGVVPPTINYDRPDPSCGPIRVVTGPETCHPRRVLVHCVGLGGFFYSAAALEKPV